MKSAQNIMPVLKQSELRLWYTALALGVVLCFVGIADRGLWAPDEPRVAAIALEMSREGNLILPRLAGEPFIEKPPLYFVIAAGFIHVAEALLGNTGAVRMSSAVWGAGILLMTFLLARRLASSQCSDGQEASPLRTCLTGAMSAALLSTMVDFFKNSHWIRVDAALAFFVIAALWSFAEVYFGRKRSFLLLAAFFSAGAFLSKGMIGPVLIGSGWVGMFVPWCLTQRREGRKGNYYLWLHAAGLALLLLLIGSWMLSLFITGGRELFNEWFFQNQLGRLTGTASMGHEKPGHLFFYIKKSLAHTLPWTPLVMFWAYRVITDLKNSGLKSISRERIFLLVWSIVSLSILTVSVSKRGLYLFPLKPVFAIMCAEALMMRFPRWLQAYFGILTGLCIIILTACTLAPLLCAFIPQDFVSKSEIVPAVWGGWNCVSGLCLAGALCLFLRKHSAFTCSQIVISVAVVYICGYKVGLPVIENRKNMQQDITAFIEHVDPSERHRIAGCGFRENMRGFFYIVSGWNIHLVEGEAEVRKILEGKNPQFDSVIIAGKGTPPNVENEGQPWHVINRVHTGGTGSHMRYLIWMTGDRVIPVTGQQKQS